MKKLLTIAPVLAILTACSTAPVAQPDPAQVHVALENAKTYKCDKSTDIVAVYGKDVVNVKITAPSLSLNQSAMILKQDKSASASGMHYSLVSSDKSTAYNWMPTTTGSTLVVSHNGTDYSFTCQML